MVIRHQFLCVITEAGGVLLAFTGLYTVQVCEELKITSVAVDHRNAGDAMGLSSNVYHSDRGGDVSDLVKWARGRFPGRQFLVIGCSMGASMIMNLRTGRYGSEQPDYAVAVWIR